MENKDKELYNSKVCCFCKNNLTCNKNKFNVYVYHDKTTFRCAFYNKIDEEPIKINNFETIEVI